VTLTDILTKKSGQQGIETIAELFGGKGLQAILSAMYSNGLAQQAKSWTGTGQNMPVSSADVKKMANPAALARMAQQEDISQDELCGHIARALPQLVDQATPDGQVPKQGGKPDGLVSNQGGKDVPAGKSRKK
jgi:uncharacterized protein YidB (DUF937 family)